MIQDEADLSSSENLLAPLNSWPRSNILVVKYNHIANVSDQKKGARWKQPMKNPGRGQKQAT